MPTQNIDLANVTSISYNGSPVTEMVLNGTSIYPVNVATGTDVSSSFVSFGEFIVTDGLGDTDSPYSVSEIQVDHSGSARLYIAHKSTAAPTYFSDAPIAAIQILDSAGTNVLHNYYFGANTNQGWSTTTSRHIEGTTGLSSTPTAAGAYIYSAITTNVNASSFGLATTTASSGTGAIDGIASPTGPMTLGNATTAQASATYYIYNETSSPTGLNDAVYMRSPVISWTSGMRVRVAYIIGNHATNQQEVDDTLFMGIA